jgi:protocatechuate 3,4-dioxygenase beta subunit
MDQTITRRDTLAGLGTVGLGTLLAACTNADGTPATTTSAQVQTSTGTSTVQPSTSTSSALVDKFGTATTCAVTPAQTEGPYYFDAKVIRSDIREDRPGMRLRLGLRVVQLDGCTPIQNATVEIWHCDAVGSYSGFEVASQGGSGGRRTDEEVYLRGAQVTNAQGIVEFVTVYPGWYRGRTVHIHTRVHPNASSVLTSQLYFDDDITKKVYATSPYNQHSGRDTSNNNDRIMTSGGGAPPQLSLEPDGDGYLGLITIGVRPT